MTDLTLITNNNEERERALNKINEICNCLGLKINPEKSITYNFYYEKKKIIRDMSTVMGNIPSDYREPFRFLGFYLCYAEVKSGAHNIIMNNMKKVEQLLNTSRTKPGFGTRAIKTYLQGAALYRTQLGHITKRTNDAVNQKTNKHIRKILRATPLMPTTLIHRDRNKGGVGIQSFEESNTIRQISSILD